jgi:hypothetical protein
MNKNLRGKGAFGPTTAISPKTSVRKSYGVADLLKYRRKSKSPNCAVSLHHWIPYENMSNLLPPSYIPTLHLTFPLPFSRNHPRSHCRTLHRHGPFSDWSYHTRSIRHRSYSSSPRFPTVYSTCFPLESEDYLQTSVQFAFRSLQATDHQRTFPSPRF